MSPPRMVSCTPSMLEDRLLAKENIFEGMNSERTAQEQVKAVYASDEILFGAPVRFK